ncbi:MAG: PGF-pre-PGF domain-containing protein, partial [Candidatus Aenigmatarchaeota archaeon]
EGVLSYVASNDGELKIPIKFSIITPVLVLNNSMENISIIIKENFGVDLTKTLYLNLSNLGNQNLSLTFSNSSSKLACVSGCNSSYFALLNFNTTSEIEAGNSSLIEINVTFNKSMPKNSVYAGWILINSTNEDSNLTSHPYSSFNISIKLNLTDRISVKIIDLKSKDWENESVNSSESSWVNVTFLMEFANGTKILPTHSLFNLSRANVWLYEPNASYSTGNLNFVNISNSNDWVINLTIPEKTFGGIYYIHINLTSSNLTSNPSDVYRGESLNDPVNKQLRVNNLALRMDLTDYPSSLATNSTGKVNVTIKNFGLVGAINAKIKLFKGSCISTVTFESSNCRYSSSGEEVTFNISALNYTGCYIVWKITSGLSAGSCASRINGTAGLWFGNISFETEVYLTETTTTTTTIPNITTTTTTTTTSTTTTTTTIPLGQQINFTARIPLITIDSPATIEIAQAEILKIQKITVFVKRNVSNVAIIVSESVKNDNIPEPIKIDEGLVFKYLEILPTNLTDEDILSITIDFQVDKSWVNKNGIDAATIALYRYSNNTWEKLQTTMLNENSDYYNFRSISPGLSLFAIAGEKTKAFPTWIIFLALGIIAAGVLAFLFWPVEEEKPIVKSKEEKEIKKPWEDLKKKWDELTRRKRL